LPGIELVAVQLPGRGTRFHEPHRATLAEIVAALAQVIAREAALPFAFFGHSLGALIAFELARHLARLGQAQPRHLFVSGCQAPRYRSPSRGLHQMSDADLLEALKSYNGTPAEILQNAELMTILLPMIRADFALGERYVYPPAPALKVPMSILAGLKDDHDSAQQYEGWKEESSGKARLRWFNGDHFFIHSERATVLNCINQDLWPYLSDAALSA
jgi:surfactin synthase thioesterase subunit